MISCTVIEHTFDYGNVFKKFKFFEYIFMIF